MLSRRTLAVALALMAHTSTRSLAQPQGLPLIGMRHDGAAMTPESAAGWRLVYFGYTHCPDVCPMGLHTMSEAITALGPIGERFTPVFVTVDPERDTPQVMGEYVSFFHPRFIGISPAPAQLADMTAAWRVKFEKVPGVNGGAYTVDHTSSIFLLNPIGQIVGRFPHSLDGKEMAQKIKGVLLRA